MRIHAAGGVGQPRRHSSFSSRFPTGQTSTRSGAHCTPRRDTATHPTAARRAHAARRLRSPLCPAVSRRGPDRADQTQRRAEGQAPVGFVATALWRQDRVRQLPRLVRRRRHPDRRGTWLALPNLPRVLDVSRRSVRGCACPIGRHGSQVARPVFRVNWSGFLFATVHSRL